MVGVTGDVIQDGRETTVNNHVMVNCMEKIAQCLVDNALTQRSVITSTGPVLMDVTKVTGAINALKNAQMEHLTTIVKKHVGLTATAATKKQVYVTSGVNQDGGGFTVKWNA